MLCYFFLQSPNRMFSYGEFKAEDQVMLFALTVLDVVFCSHRVVLAWTTCSSLTMFFHFVVLC